MNISTPGESGPGPRMGIPGIPVVPNSSPDPQRSKIEHLAQGAAVVDQTGDSPENPTFPIARTIAYLDEAIGLCLDPEHVVNLLERRAVLEALYEATISAAFEGAEAIKRAAASSPPPTPS